MFAAIHTTTGDAEKLLRLAQEFSPLVERTTADTVALDADGLERIYGLPQEIAAALARRAAECGLKAGVAIAANLDAAVHAARGFAGVSVIPHGDEAKFLGSLPLALLEPTPGTLETLERWGIRRFRDLAALP
jgi:protein ImuB